jgi:hypothetical protein
MTGQHDGPHQMVRSTSAERLVEVIATRDTGWTPAPGKQKGTLQQLQAPLAELFLHAKVLPQTECFASTECGSSAKKHKIERWFLAKWTSCVLDFVRNARIAVRTPAQFGFEPVGGQSSKDARSLRRIGGDMIKASQAVTADTALGQEPGTARPQARRVRRATSPTILPTATIAMMTRDALLDVWVQVFGNAAPKNLSKTLLRRFLAFECQARMQGGLSSALINQLTRKEAGTARKTSPGPKPGGRVLREWNGVTHTVEILPEGCLWQGKTYPSLSAVARAITGAHWSGPRFFGLTAANPAISKTQAAKKATRSTSARPDSGHSVAPMLTADKTVMEVRS